jgi:hypothetical protein
MKVGVKYVLKGECIYLEVDKTNFSFNENRSFNAFLHRDLNRIYSDKNWKSGYSFRDDLTYCSAIWGEKEKECYARFLSTTKTFTDLKSFYDYIEYDVVKKKYKA